MSNIPKDASRLFYESPLVDTVALRKHARWQIENSPLIQGCVAGSIDHARAMHVFFWYFVYNIELIIDERTQKLPRDYLYDRFSRQKVRRVLTFVARQLRVMQKEEGQHALLWRGDAKRLGLSEDQLGGKKYAGIRDLVDLPRNAKELWKLFCFLAGGEYIAEELSRMLCGSPKYLALFTGAPQHTWTWGEAHLAVHPGPSHLEIDEDLARALSSDDDEETLREELEFQTKLLHRTFFKAAGKIANDIQLPNRVLVA